MAKNTRRTKGDGSLHKTAKGLWRARIELPPDPQTGARRRKEVTAKTFEEASKKLRALRRSLDESGDLPTSTPIFSTWLEKTWLPRLDRRRIKPSTLDFYESKTRLYIIPAIGTARLERIGTQHVRKVLDYVAQQGLSSTTARHAFITLSIALDDAVRDGHLLRNPCSLMEPPPTELPPDDTLAVSQARDLLRLHTDDPAMFARLMTYLYTGMRRGEVLGLTGASPDFRQGIIRVDWAIQRLTYRHGCTSGECGRKRGADCPLRYVQVNPGIEARQVQGGLYALRPKSKTSRRAVPMLEPLSQTLSTYIKDAGIGPDDWLFPASNGGPMDPQEDYRQLKAAFARVGGYMRPHALRHTTSTLFDLAGVPEHYRIQILGHAGKDMARRYTHTEMNTIKGAMSEFPKLLDFNA